MKTQVVTIHPEFPEIDLIAKCAQIIKQGGLVIFPTETVYGIAADATNPKAMARLREVKQRSDQKPFTYLISQKGLISNYTAIEDPGLYKLVDRFWPGPLTIIASDKFDKSKTVGVRMPDNLIAQKLTQEAYCRVAAPSANIEGRPAPQTCQEALADLDGLVDIAIDGGPANIGRSSTIVDVREKEPVILREGSISKEDILKVKNKKTILFVCTGNSCRSVMAEYLLKKAVATRDDVEVLSAGTSVFLQATASMETISVLKDEGADPTGHTSKPISSILLKKSDLIFVMTRQHRSQVLERVPSVEKRVYLLREFASNLTSSAGELDIPDPMGHDRAAYGECKEVIKDCINKVVELL